ncbi:hypothetical protein BC829DRAFT_398694 [Chytridium lagenaria]|nr:hypothetical protein BC829DRAFT_398694 [Chytridium lagenaria]
MATGFYNGEWEGFTYMWEFFCSVESLSQYIASGKPTTVELVNQWKPSLRYPELAITRSHAVSDLPLEVRESSYEKIQQAISKHINPQNPLCPLWTLEILTSAGDFPEARRCALLKTFAVSLETWCFLKSKHAVTYKTLLSSRLREIISPSFLSTIVAAQEQPHDPSVSNNISCGIFQEELRKVASN